MLLKFRQYSIISLRQINFQADSIKDLIVNGKINMVNIVKNIKIMLKQHIGDTAAPIVSTGDTVKKGQLLAVPRGLGANIHSSVYGKVVEINPDAIVIKPDAHQPTEFIKIKDTANHLEAIKEAGIVGAGGAGFPTHVKFNTNLDGGCVIVNAAECEPTLFHNSRVLEENPGSILRGLTYIMEITNAAKGFIAIKPHDKVALIHLEKAIEAYTREIKNSTNETADSMQETKDSANEINSRVSIEIRTLPDMYPAGDERVVVREILGIELEPGQLPSTVGAIVSNVETVKRVQEAIELRKPVITKDITVGGRLRSTLGNSPQVFLEQPLGVPVSQHIKECGGVVAPAGEILLGGPFMGASGDEDDPLTKTTSGVFVAMPYPVVEKKFGIMACECGAPKERLRGIVAGMGGTVISETLCKRMMEVNGRYRCEKPGNCPGQAENALYLKKQGAQAILTSACQD